MENIFKCRVCGTMHKNWSLVFENNMPLAAQVLDEPSKKLQKYHINVVRCNNCGHIQLSEALNLNLYDNYLYTPSYAGGFITYINEFVKCLNLYINKKQSPTVLEIGSSNGYLLERLKEQGWKVLGIEPSKVLADVSIEHGIETINDYFGENIIDDIKKRIGKLDVIILRHVMEHLENLDNIVAAIKKILGDGLLLIEVPYLCKIIKEKQFYAFFHEHLSYFSVTSLNLLLGKSDFYIHNVYENTLEGGSILVCANSNPIKKMDDNVREYLEKEKEILSEVRIEKFSAEICKDIGNIKEIVKNAIDNNKTIAAWGAGQRGCTLISICEFQSDNLKYVIDVNENYWWKYVPGTDIQIVPPIYYKEKMVDEIIILATGYADSIIAENIEYVKCGGKFIKIIE